VKDRNHILGSVITYSPKFRKADAQFNAIYCKNIITTDSANVNFENLTYTHQFQFKSGFGHDMNISWFKNNLSDTTGNDIYLTIIDLSYTTKKRSKFSAGAKMAFKVNENTQYGFRIKASVKIYKGLFWETEAEKILIGEYYNSLMVDQMKKFPYYCNTKLILNF
jgi:hypothetical protein